MKKITRILAVILVAVMVFSFTACSNWVVKGGGETVPKGIYALRMISAFYMAEVELDLEEALTTKELLKKEIDGVSAEEWIKDFTLEAVKKYIAVEKEFKRLELKLSDNSIAYAKSMAASQWKTYQFTYAKNGISLETLENANINSRKESVLFWELYGEGGEQEVTDSQIEDFFEENYFTINEILLPKKDEDGKVYDEAKLQELRDKAQDYLERAATEDFDQLVAESMDEHIHEGETYEKMISKEKSGYEESTINKLTAAKVGDVFMDEDDEYILVIKKCETEDVDEIIEKNHDSLVTEMKTDEFGDYLLGVADEMDIKVNEKNFVAPSKMKLD